MRSGWRILSLLSCLFVSSVVNADPSDLASSQEKQTIVTMKDQKGRIVTFTEAIPSEIAAIFETPLNEANSFVMRARNVDCARVEQDIELQAGFLMELPFIVETLNTSKVPILSGSQKETLSRVPFCDPYLLELKIIAHQLNGWKLEKKEVITTIGDRQNEPVKKQPLRDDS